MVEEDTFLRVVVDLGPIVAKDVISDRLVKHFMRKGEILKVTRGPYRHRQYAAKEITIMNVKNKLAYTIELKRIIHCTLPVNNDQQKIMKKLY